MTAERARHVKNASFGLIFGFRFGVLDEESFGACGSGWKGAFGEPEGCDGREERGGEELVLKALCGGDGGCGAN